MKLRRPHTIGEIFADGTLIDQALGQAVQDAVEKHRDAGQPLAVWKGGKTVWVPPEEIGEQQNGKRTKPQPARRRTTRRRS
jgi:hypothetical protein